MAAIPENVAKYLTPGSTDLNAADDRNETPLSRAVVAKDVEAVKYLVANKVDVNKCVKKGEVTPVLLAARSQSLEIVKLLVDAGVDVNKKTKRGESPLHAAAKVGPVSVIQYLLEHKADVNAHNDSFWTPISIASKFLDVEAIKVFLANGADAKLKDMKENSCIFLAASKGKYDIMKYLIDQGLEVNYKKANLDGQTLLHLAAEGGNTQCVELCLANGSDLTKKDMFNNTPLDNACWAGDLNMIKFLVGKGAKPISANKSKNTILNLYLMSEKEPTVEGIKYIIGLGVNVNEPNIHGNTALSIATSKDWKEAEKYLKSINAKAGTPL
ncbi:uncoordinated, putative [Trichomonas vaginalis G3]|uniref:Uncoordinated, putative n=1 Tax=Trichomonas vaginalis (strain ATCC PRA-98 / G3) TaxID=412133 RepID=A2DZR6_TRIV3|nr:spectrin binding [Trichomonas vaginalis G3]EAY14134.1 uncoordinated, putative [Trichomonas vaginalis G3]KAI5525144.1 spectrin binding [Trichomonas vaginalis G3]|eukprot:XP_001326357.1 uncoordinated [Trichomonas vaginalis G3]